MASTPPQGPNNNNGVLLLNGGGGGTLENPFRPEGELSKEADAILGALKSGSLFSHDKPPSGGEENIIKTSQKHVDESPNHVIHAGSNNNNNNNNKSNSALNNNNSIIKETHPLRGSTDNSFRPGGKSEEGPSYKEVELRRSFVPKGNHRTDVETVNIENKMSECCALM
eukprot:TRINITY_DN4570_c0_g1_i1.p1 TRINITY_DN4570_c0_g1~~TRINITY_DN4570_c0_g1_i1.p1  ORF type:complete len:169 (+),score=60.80 TRINITY_DN4570_c0_g1_i1:285-791(+)